MRKLFIIAAVIGMVALVSASADAGALRSVGFGGGYVSPDNVDGTWTVGVNFDVSVPVQNLYIQPFAGYWSKSEEASAAGISASASISDWLIGGNAKYVITTSATNVHPYIQGGAAVHLLKAETESSFLGQPLSLSATDTKIGFQAGGGVAFDVSERWGVFGQGSYHFVSDFNQWMVGVGAQVNL